MRFAIIASLAALAMASPAKRQDYPDCEIGRKVFYSPDAITIEEPFHVKYCSSTYFKTSSNTTFFSINRNETSIETSVIIASRDAYYDGYEFDITIPYSGNYGFAENSYWQIVEVINDYYVPRSFTTLTKPVTINPAPSSS